MHGTLVAAVGVVEEGQTAEVALLAPFGARDAMGGVGGGFHCLRCSFDDGFNFTSVSRQTSGGNVYPADVSFPFPYQFVHGGQGLQEGKILLAFLHRWQVNVCRLASEVLGVLHATYGAVQFGATVAAIYADGAEPVSQGL